MFSSAHTRPSLASTLTKLFTFSPGYRGREAWSEEWGEGMLGLCASQIIPAQSRVLIKNKTVHPTGCLVHTQIWRDRNTIAGLELSVFSQG